ncbi:8818_t:CDS:2 [Funneliformis geosporum]|uniref:E3 ubiquitin-protein ligase n=1 Tax=Funneliformis geosporum TaxID=1117311 RepID=A0A9W4SP20_9GLOM|nr:8818_t:CDS:2 [Funneliformis geosporum]
MATVVWNVVNKFGTHTPVISIVIDFMKEVINIAREASQNNKRCKELQSRLSAVYETLEVHIRNISDDYPFGKKNTENLMRALDECRKFLLRFRKGSGKALLNMLNSDEISIKIRELNESLSHAQLGIILYINAKSNVNSNPKPQILPPSTPPIPVVLYHCRTCTIRNNSVLCSRCYTGTNHIGHDVITIKLTDPNMSVWCDCGDPEYWKFHLNCKFHSSNTQKVGTSHCGKKIALKEVYYQCRTCTTRNDSVICSRCYAGSNHVGHDVISITNSWPGAWCDCGDSDYWRIPLNCKYHPQTPTTVSRSHTTSSTNGSRSQTTSSTTGYNKGSHNSYTSGSRSHNNNSTTGSRSHKTSSTTGTRSHTGVCGHVFAYDETVYRCWTCSVDSSIVICSSCFNPTKHLGHDVDFYVSNISNGAFCDCGDKKSWKVPINCSDDLSNAFQGLGLI